MNEMQTEHGTGLRGVFSTEGKMTIGHGSTKRKVKKQLFVFAEELDDGNISLRPLNEKFLPAGTATTITKKELLKSYLPEPAMYVNKVYPVLRNLSQTVAKGEDHLRRGETFSAEYEFKNALRLDEKHIRATFGLGLSYLQQGDAKKGEIVFRRLVKLDGAFEKRHKHLFNEFGIQLRKCKLYTQALQFYFRAYKLSRQDENLLYNIARTLCELDRLKSARFFLNKALALNPFFTEAESLFQYVEEALLDSGLELY